ncbi:MAG: DUF4259 domain-containing protein [Longibaculum muris]|uniref:Uncharacterized protein DUF4259 n=2 Tax=Longibaculum muris TaxID=1796628 RepID=A0A4V2W5T8_9FIRM|nr:DUF4259 domain-containing protein [Longibaculum muris]KXU45401.1 hypothetical protein HMPREF3037_02277 [Candidatus Stoquefichus sp. KLE1796]MBS5369518.1 DUF4259 domain-containing protein [Coprobacillus cateniformis]MCR1886610.1 DUF4259 domain-containing protein [Longibaculum muris]MED9813085.1 DUF4259 domain-containing protein [Longibaculum muris]TCW01662.1 uncharacterized protein DUF4259 [Longibaculum muris]
MGAWDFAVFDDDTAYDVLDDLKESSDIIKDMEKYFDDVIEADYVEYEEGYYALVSAAVLDSVVNDTQYRCDDEDYFEWIKSLKKIDLTSLQSKAIKAIDVIISDKSELKELWEENEELYSSWREDKRSIQKRLL